MFSRQILRAEHHAPVNVPGNAETDYCGSSLLGESDSDVGALRNWFDLVLIQGR